MSVNKVMPEVLHVVDLPWTDAALNAASEEVLFRTPPGDDWLLFYRNGPSVLWGRNQDPAVECDLDYCHQAGLQVVRRLSGGGAVYHDLGNFNYCFVVARATFAPELLLHLVVQALFRCGITARVCSRRSIWVGESKVSGTALAMNGKRVLLHGCLLLQADLTCLRRVLRPFSAISARGKVASVRSPVMNLCELVPGLDGSTVRAALLEAVATVYTVRAESVLPPVLAADGVELCRCWEKLRSPGWVYHHD